MLKIPTSRANHRQVLLTFTIALIVFGSSAVIVFASEENSRIAFIKGWNVSLWMRTAATFATTYPRCHLSCSVQCAGYEFLCFEELKVAVRVGFEPTEPVKVQRFSRPPDSTTLAPHRTSKLPDFPAFANSAGIYWPIQCGEQNGLFRSMSPSLRAASYGVSADFPLPPASPHACLR